MLDLQVHFRRWSTGSAPASIVIDVPIGEVIGIALSHAYPTPAVTAAALLDAINSAAP